MHPASQLEFTARYTMSSEDGEYRFRFYCAYCDRGHEAGAIIHADSIGAALRLACEESRLHFNGCRKCGKSVCDEHYCCTECATPDTRSKAVNARSLRRRGSTGKYHCLGARSFREFCAESSEAFAKDALESQVAGEANAAFLLS
jgi:hypothetical protein